MQPLVSIVTIAFNDRDNLLLTIKNVIAQTFKNFEFIIIDGNSSDGSKEVIEEYKDKFTYWVSEPDKGIYDAMNKGIKSAKGQWLIFMNAGDRFYQDDTLSKVHFKGLDSKAIIYGDTWRREKKIVTKGFISKNKGNRILRACHQSMFFNKNLLKDKLWYDDSLDMAGDTALTTALYLKGYEFVYQELVIADYDQGGLSSGGNLSKKMLWKNRRDKYLRTFKHFGFAGLYRELVASIKVKKSEI